MRIRPIDKIAISVNLTVADPVTARIAVSANLTIADPVIARIGDISCSGINEKAA